VPHPGRSDRASKRSYCQPLRSPSLGLRRDTPINMYQDYVIQSIQYSVAHLSPTVLTRRRLGYMVMDLDLEEKTMRKEKLRTGSATSTSMVDNTSMPGLGYNPNWHNKGRPKKTRKGH
jgi:hypothetical protein